MTDNVTIAGSLRNRLTFTLIGGAAILAIVLYVAIRSYAAQIAQQGQDHILRGAVSSILDAAIIQNGEVEVDFPYASFSMLNTPSDDKVFYSILQDSILLSGYDDLPLPSVREGEKFTFVTTSYAQETVRLASASRTLVGAEVKTQISVSIAQTQDALSLTLNRISRNVAYFCAGFFLLATMLSFWATFLSISPLRRLANSITRRGPGDLSPVAKPVPSEMAPLVGSLNTLMSRLDQSLRQSEEFIAEAAHRVRTPLATVRAHAENTYQRVEKEENRKALRAMIRAVDESSRAAGQLLDHAMITVRADHLKTEEIDLVVLVGDLIQSLSPVAEMKDIELEIQGDSHAQVTGDVILLQNALRNLLDNALKYAPFESRVTITVSAAPRPRVEIRDQGPGYPPGDIDTLVSRFTRGSNTGGAIGSGLGLTIAHEVALVHGGSLYLKNHSQGGACVTFSF